MEYEDKKVRYELKYYISGYEYSILARRLASVMKGDSFSDHNNEYHVRSLYFDDIYNSALYEKQSGVERRNKYRMRIYNLDDSVIKLEKKSKYGQYVSKDTAVIDRAHAERILKGDIGFLGESRLCLLRDYFLQMRTNLLKPVVIVDYMREAYVLDMGNIRITFDKHLSTCLNSTSIFSREIPSIPVLDGPLTIMEVKYDSFLPAYIRNLLEISIKPRVAVSKYAICRKLNKFNAWEDN